MLKVTELLPGLIVGAVLPGIGRKSLREWALNRLASPELSPAKEGFVPGVINWNDLMLTFFKQNLDGMSKDLCIIADKANSLNLITSGEWLNLLTSALNDHLDLAKFCLWLLSIKRDKEFYAGTIFIQQLCNIMVTKQEFATINSLSTISTLYPINFLSSTLDNINLYAMRFMIDWLYENFSEDQVVLMVKKWLSSGKAIPIGLVCGILCRQSLLQKLSVDLKFIIHLFVKYISALKPREIYPVFSAGARNAIVCSVLATSESKLPQSSFSFVNVYVKSILDLNVLSKDDLRLIAERISEIVVSSKKSIDYVEYITPILEKCKFDDMDASVCSLFVLYSSPISNDILTRNFDSFSDSLNVEWAEKDLITMTNFLLDRMSPLLGQCNSRHASWNVLRFLSSSKEDQLRFLGTIDICLKVLVPIKMNSIDQGKYCVAILTICRKIIAIIVRKTANSLTKRALDLLIEMIKILANHNVDLSSDLKGHLLNLLMLPEFKQVLSECISYYENKTSIKIRTGKAQIRPIVDNSTPPFMRDFQNRQRLIDSLQSRNVQIISKTSMSKLEAIKSEMASSRAEISKLQTSSLKMKQLKVNHSSILASQAPPPKRIAHEARDMKGSSDVESESDDELKSVKDALRKESSKTQEHPHRSIKIIDINGRGGPMDPEVTRLLPKKQVSFPRDGYFWHKMQRHILSLDYHSLCEDRIESQPINRQARDSIPSFFKDFKEYESVFAPLLFIEAEAQIVKAKEEIEGSEPSDSLIHLTISSISMVDDFHEVLFKDIDREASKALSELDLVIVDAKHDDPSSRILGIVYSQDFKKGVPEIGIRFYFTPSKASLQILLKEGAKVCCRTLYNLITCTREHQALSHLPSFGPITEQILNPHYLESASYFSEREQIIPHLMDTFALNRSQGYAVASSLLDRNAFTLIQGPPGTGKTRTIEALLSAATLRAHLNGVSIMATKKILVCAPSNAAIDEIVRRIMNGLEGGQDGGRVRVPMVRIGSHEMIDDAVKHISLDSLTEKAVQDTLASLRRQIEEQKSHAKDLSLQLEISEKTNGQNPDAKKSLWEAKDAIKKSYKQFEEARAAARMKILHDARIVCCTLTGAGHDSVSRLHNSQQFDMVVIDEACQAVELSTLIPLQWGCRKCILVGDPNQLPPTLISKAAVAYEQSLFCRLQKANPKQVLLLSVQYRMHPEISAFPSAYYYQGRLLNGPTVVLETGKPWHSVGVLGPYRFFDVPGEEKRRQNDSGRAGKSMMNHQEAQMATFLVAFLCHQFPEINVTLFTLTI